MVIDYQLDGAGWASCCVRHGVAVCRMRVSYLSDALGNLVLAAVEVVRGAPSVVVSFDEEPGEFRWLIRGISPTDVHVQIRWFEELWGGKPDDLGELWFEARVPRIAFGGAVRDAAAKVLAMHGRDGYQMRWVEHEFPERPMELLVEALGTLR